ncbi:MAG: Gfo/Idh/MocA family oxidoreductase [Pseudomonadota bacterium]
MTTIRFGIIGGGLMGKELASAAARWMHIDAPFARPEITAICDVNADARDWFTDNVPTCAFATDDHRALLARDDVDAVYCAVPHDLHADLYLDIIAAGKHLLGEKPFGIDKPANDRILAAVAAHPDVLVRSSSEFPFFPGAQAVIGAVADGTIGQVIGVRARFLHSSDLDPNKAINWKRVVAKNGAYGCMGDLGLHVMHIPLRFGWEPVKVAAQLTKIVEERPDGLGGTAPCETWDNAAIHGMVAGQGRPFPITFETRRIAPGEMNTWEIEIDGTARSIAFSTKYPKTLRVLDYESGGPQDWKHRDLGYASAYRAITGGIFEFGFPDSLQQMVAAFLDELVHGPDGMTQPFHCATPEETAASHRIMTAALENAL